MYVVFAHNNTVDGKQRGGYIEQKTNSALGYRSLRLCKLLKLRNICLAAHVMTVINEYVFWYR